MSEIEAFSVRMDLDIKEALEDLSKITGKSQNFLINFYVTQGLKETYLQHERIRLSRENLIHTTTNVEKIFDKWIRYFKSR